MSETEKTAEPAAEVASPAKRSAFVHIPDDKIVPLPVLNAKARRLTAERRADLDEKHDVVQKAVRAAFGRGKEVKPVVPVGSPRARELKADAAKAAEAAKADKK